MKVLTSKGFLVVNYTLLLAGLKAPASHKLTPCLAYSFSDNAIDAEIFENYEHAMTAYRNAKFKRDISLIDVFAVK